MSETRDFTPAQSPEEVANYSNTQAVQYHYDNETDFFALWLDSTITYSSGRWFAPLNQEVIVADLAGAQQEKLRFHLDAVAMKPGGRLLDIGCGWGGVLSRAVTEYEAREVLGLTLSEDQVAHIEGFNDPRIKVRLEDFFKFRSDDAFDGVISIGAFEHFADPTMSRAQKIAVYREFFERCHQMTTPRSSLSLQTIVWDHVDFEEAKTLIPETVFPNSDIPFIDEIVGASNGTYFLEYLENRRDDYTKTLEAWLKSFQAQKPEIIARWGEVKYRFFEDYLRTSRIAFLRRKNSLARLVFRRR